ncbi:hypothetical protein GQ42DRAFT_21168 [Ramicandelaber brevisporus]|nr:hypothetical protein GQ42DRAFT_21168 [Ramicandelaber brevisporus]
MSQFNNCKPIRVLARSYTQRFPIHSTMMATTTVTTVTLTTVTVPHLVAIQSGRDHCRWQELLTLSLAAMSIKKHPNKPCRYNHRLCFCSSIFFVLFCFIVIHVLFIFVISFSIVVLHTCFFYL